MPATVKAVEIERSGPAIRAALATHAPEDCTRFEAELRTALARAADDLDLSVVETVPLPASTPATSRATGSSCNRPAMPRYGPIWVKIAQQ